MPSAQVEWTSDDMHVQVDACTSEARAATEVQVHYLQVANFCKGFNLTRSSMHNGWALRNIHRYISVSICLSFFSIQTYQATHVLLRHLPAQGTFELTGKDDNKQRTTFRGSSRGPHICIVNKATNLCRLVTPSLFADTNFRLIGNRRATCQPASPYLLPVKKQNTSFACLFTYVQHVFVFRPGCLLCTWHN